MSYHLKTYQDKSGRGLNIIYMSGAIDAVDWGQWQATTSLLNSDLDTLVVVDSPGGEIPGSAFLINKIDTFIQEQAANGHKVAIYINKNS